jgi:ketosteroid isomerase-like protein
MDSATAAELIDIQHKLAAAWAAGDDSVHRRILADDWKVTDPGGNVLTKEQVIGTAFSADRNITTARIDDIEVRDFGDWAIVTGRTHMAGTLAGENIYVTLRFTDVFARRQGEWRCLVSQGTLVNE